MLDRIRKALGRPTLPTGHTDPADVTSDVCRRLERLEPLGDVMQAVPPDQLVARLEDELGKVAVSTGRASSLSELERILTGIFNSARASTVVLSRNPLLTRLGIESRLRIAGKAVAAWPAPPPSSVPPIASTEAASDAESDSGQDFRHQCFSAEVGITGVDLALAESGTFVVTSLTEGSQLASLAPPVHVVLYRREQVVATLEEVLDNLPGLPGSTGSSDPTALVPGRSVVFITGTSRTADIEQILIRGVHGPRDVHAILIEEACLGV